MMINKRLIGTVSESKKFIAGNVALQWLSLLPNMALMTAVTALLAGLLGGTAGKNELLRTLLLALCGPALKRRNISRT